MQIHELPSGTLTSSDVIAMDNGTSTRKISLNSLVNGKNAQTLDANWLNMNCVVASNGVKFIRCSTYPNANMTGGTEYHVGTLQTDYRPTYAVSHYVKWGGGSTAFGLLKITQEGVVTFTPDINISTSTGININFAFI